MSVPQPQPNSQRKVITNTRRRRVQKGNMKDPGGWLFSPATLEFFRTAEWKLEDLTELREGARRAMDRLRASRVDGENKIYLYPTDSQDVDGLELKRRAGTAYVNLIEFLIDSDLTVAPGYKELYDLVQVGLESPVGHALMMDLDKPREKVLTGRGKKKSSQSAAKKKSQSAGTAQSSTATPAPAPEKEAPDQGTPESK